MERVTDSLWGAAAGGSFFTVAGRVWLPGDGGPARGAARGSEGLWGDTLISLASLSLALSHLYVPFLDFFYNFVLSLFFGA